MEANEPVSALKRTIANDRKARVEGTRRERKPMKRGGELEEDEVVWMGIVSPEAFLRTESCYQS